MKSRVERGFNNRNPKLTEELLADHNVLLGGIDLRQRLAERSKRSRTPP